MTDKIPHEPYPGWEIIIAQDKPIKNKQDYGQALKRIEKLMDAKKNSKELDELDILVTLVEAYEDKNYPIYSPQ